MKVAQMLHCSTAFEVLGFAILEDGMQIWKKKGNFQNMHTFTLIYDVLVFGDYCFFV